MKIKTYRFVKEEVAETEIFIPQEPYYCFETGIRRSIRIIPKWTTWQLERFQKPEEIWELEVTCIYQSSQCKIEKFTIRTSQIEDLNNKNEQSNPKSIVTLLLNDWGDSRTKEDFELDLEQVIKEIKIS